MNKKKFAIGCLAAIGGVVVIVVIVTVIISVIKSPDTEESPDTEQTSVRRLQVELIEAQKNGDIEVTASGTGSPIGIDLHISSLSEYRLEVSILPGTVFVSPESGIQDMVVTKESELLVEPYGYIDAAGIDAVSMNMRLDAASENSSLALSMTSAKRNIMKLLKLADFQDESYRVQQFTVWTITDNPARGDFIGISPSGSDSGPTDEEVERIQFLCDKAGIITGYWLLQKPVYVELTEAKSRGLIDVDVCGDNSLDRVQIKISSKTGDPLEIAVLPGTMFTAQSADVQSMVVVKKDFLTLYPHKTIGPRTIGAACANMRLDVPGESDYLGLSITPSSEDLMKLLELPDFHKEPLRVRQFAIWTITDNPAFDEYVGIGTFVSSSGPTHEEIEKVRLLFIEAGISVVKYNALRS